MYLVALFRNGTDYSVFHTKTEEDVKSYDEFLKQNGYKLESCVITTEITVALKTRLKFRLRELRSLDSKTDYLGYREVLMLQIGSLVRRLQNRGIEVTDELALYCYKFRQAERTGL